MKIGYARVSTDEQSLDMQIDALRAAGAERIETDIASGGRRDRGGLNRALSSLSSGDVLIVWGLDRLGRSLSHVVSILDDLRARDVDFVSLTQPIDTTTPNGRLLFGMIAVFAEYEREIIRARVKAGLAAARARGVVGGRPRRFTLDQTAEILRLIVEGKSYRTIARLFETSPSTIDRAVKRAKASMKQ